MESVLGQSWMVVPTSSVILLHAEVSSNCSNYAVRFVVVYT